MIFKRLLSKISKKKSGSTLFPILNREYIAEIYLKGNGLEIGALHNPLKIPISARVKYIDRLSLLELRKQYPELDKHKLVCIDIIDHGEKLNAIRDSTQDFVIANHFLEHCQNPIGAIENMLRVLKDGGILYLAIPDKRFIFDSDRQVTSLEHVLKDYREGPERSKRQHYEEMVKLVNKVTDEIEAQKEIHHLMSIEYSIHYHCWTQNEMIEMISVLQKIFYNFEVELFLRNETEVIMIFRKKNNLKKDDIKVFKQRALIR